jgi:hypothetical protein
MPMAPAMPPKVQRMRETRLFETRCKGCGRVLVTVERLRDSEIAVITDHLRLCITSEPLEDAPALGTIMRLVRVAAVERA